MQRTGEVRLSARFQWDITLSVLQGDIFKQGLMKYPIPTPIKGRPAKAAPGKKRLEEKGYGCPGLFAIVAFWKQPLLYDLRNALFNSFILRGP